MRSARWAWVVGAVWLVAPVAAHGQNLVVNGDFENGATGWSGGTAATDTPHAGTACLQVVDADSAAGPAAVTADLIAIAPGQAYLFEGWVRGSADDQQTLVTLNQYDAGRAWIPGHNMDFVVTAGVAWAQFRFVIRNFDQLTGYVGISLRPVRWTEAGELLGSAWFDDIFFGSTSVTSEVRGQWLASTAAARIWRSPVEQKVRRGDLLADSAPTASELALSAAAGEYEPLQLVIAPLQAGALTSATLTVLHGPAGASVQPTADAIREVAYVEITDPTDQASFGGWMPDPLPALTAPLALSAGQAQPLWITLHPAADAPAGDYSGTLTLDFSSGDTVAVPVRLTVRAFALPASHHLRTAYGLSLGSVDRYHNLAGNPAKRRAVWRRYLDDLAAHRISPYNPFGDDGIGVAFTLNWPASQTVLDPLDSNNHVLEIDDQSTSVCIGVQSALAIAVQPATDYALSWRARSDGSHDYLVAVDQYDATGRWISGHNIDLERSGNGNWQSESAVIAASQLTAETASIRLTLYARPWTADGAGTGRTWFDDLLLVASGRSDNLITNGDFELTPDQADVAIDFTAFDEAATLAFDQLHFDSFDLWLQGFGWGNFLEQHPGELLGYGWDTPEYQALFNKMVRAISAHLADQGWLGLAYTYWFDEPDPDDYDFVNFGNDLIGTAEPRLTRLMTEQIEPALVGHVDLWVPLFDLYSPTLAQQRQQAGDEVWWYVCTGPRAPYPNNFIDHPGIEHRIRPWMAWRYGVQGELYWAIDYWTESNAYPTTPQDPWVDPASHYFQNNVAGNFGNGDGRLIYPPRNWSDGQERIEGPTPSLRWELLREGLEDYEYLWLLKDAADRLAAAGVRPDLVTLARGLLEVPTTIFVSRTEYSDDSAPLLAQREQIAAAIEQLLAALATVPTDAGAGNDAGGRDRAGADAPGPDANAADRSAADAMRSDSAGRDQIGSDGGGADAASASGDAGDSGEVGDAGCGCSTAGHATTFASALLVVAGLALLRRRRRALSC
jgi:MYXO-CTERM domain-containing protein